MLLENKQVAIIGAGPAGLTLARLLQQKGVGVAAYERDTDPSARQQGSSLDLHYDTGLKAIAAVGLLDEFKKRYRPGADRIVIVDGQMDVRVDEPVDDQSGDFNDEIFKPEIDRGVLRDLLVGSLKKGTVVWGARFTEMRPSGTGWQMRFGNGTAACADVVVAADGGKSKARTYITDIRAIYSGKLGLEGYVYDAAVSAPGIWQFIKGRNLVAVDQGRIMILPSKGGGTLNYIIPMESADNWPAGSDVDLSNSASLWAWFEGEFPGWSSKWQELFPPDALSVVARPWYYYPADQRWKTLPNLTVIGDAAHLMPPDGEGGNQALADALDLSEALCSDEFGSLEDAIAAFEQRMRERCARVHENVLRLLENLHSENNTQFFMGLHENSRQSPQKSEQPAKTPIRNFNHLLKQENSP